MADLDAAVDGVVDGRWYVVATSLPFWRGRTDPSISYTPLPDGRVLDVVSYRRGGRERLVLGTDVPDGEGWAWRGVTPLTRLTSSRWRVVGADDDPGRAPGCRWAVTAFERTLFTPAGVDVYCRAPRIDPTARTAAEAVIGAAPQVRALGDRLFVPTHRR